MSPLTVLNVAYPLAPVGHDAVGGAEQVLHAIDCALVEAGHRSVVVACEGSRTAGRLICTPAPGGTLDSRARIGAIEQHRLAVHDALRRWSIDVVHLHGHDFDAYLPPEGPAVLATIHLPPELLLARIDRIGRPHTWLHGVSQTQHRRLAHVPHLLPPIENGVVIDSLPRATSRGTFALMLSRVCPEKGTHLALEAAQRAHMPLLVGGMVFPYGEHQRYFETEVLPRISRERRFVGPLSMHAKRRLLCAARCLLVPSLIEETSSLAAMEALACGTPVIAFAAGALPEIVDHGVTGFIVRDVEEMAVAMCRIDRIDPDACREVARRRFSAERMCRRYIERYEQIRSWSQTSAHQIEAYASPA